MTFENFPKAPVQEALIDLRVTFKDVPVQSQFESIAQGIQNHYPKRDVLHQHQTTVKFDGDKSAAEHDARFSGLRFESPDRNFVFQAQLGGFTISKLRPYSDWNELLVEARKLWAVYCQNLSPISVERIACRYINRFDVPAAPFDFKEYLVCPPEVPSALPQGVSKYFVQMEIPLPELRATALVNQVLEGVNDSVATIILDFDVFRTYSYDINEGLWWSDLGLLRDWKNRFFFASITEKTKEMFR